MRRYGRVQRQLQRHMRRQFLLCFRNRFGFLFIRTVAAIVLTLGTVLSLFIVIQSYRYEMKIWVYFALLSGVISALVLYGLLKCEHYIFRTSLLSDGRNVAHRFLRRVFPRMARRLARRTHPLPVGDIPMCERPVAQHQGEDVVVRMEETSLDVVSVDSIPVVPCETPISMAARLGMGIKRPCPAAPTRHSYEQPSDETVRQELQEELLRLQTPPMSVVELAVQPRRRRDEGIAIPGQVLDVRRLSDPNPFPHQEAGRIITRPDTQFGFPIGGERSDWQVSAQPWRPRLEILPDTPSQSPQDSPQEERPAQGPTFQVSPPESRVAQDPAPQDRRETSETSQELRIPLRQTPAQCQRLPISTRQEGPAQGPRLLISSRQEGPAQGPRLLISPRQVGPAPDPRLLISPSQIGPAQGPPRQVSTQQRPRLQIEPQIAPQRQSVNRSQFPEPVQDPGSTPSPRRRPARSSKNLPEVD